MEWWWAWLLGGIVGGFVLFLVAFRVFLFKYLLNEALEDLFRMMAADPDWRARTIREVHQIRVQQKGRSRG